jgi:hypothetical protein
VFRARPFSTTGMRSNYSLTYLTSDAQRLKIAIVIDYQGFAMCHSHKLEADEPTDPAYELNRQCGQ